MGLLRASFVPPRAIRDLRDYTRARARLVQERTRCWQRLEKLLEGALVKLSSVASKLTTVSAQDMIRAMIAGQRDPRVLAALARTGMKAKHDELVEAQDGMFDDHHGELAQLLLDQIAGLDDKITRLGTRVGESVAALPAAWGINADGTTGPGAGTSPDAAALPAVARLAEIPGVSENLTRAIVAETGLDMARFPTAGHLVSWAGLCPSARQSGTRTRASKKGRGNTWLRGSLGQAATGAARTQTLLGERYHRIARRRGKTRAQVAVARSILVIIWHTCWPTRPPGTPTWAPATTRTAPTRTGNSRTTSGRSKRSASPSPLIRPPNPIPPLTRPDAFSSPGPLPHAHLPWTIFRSAAGRGFESCRARQPRFMAPDLGFVSLPAQITYLLCREPRGGCLATASASFRCRSGCPWLTASDRGRTGHPGRAPGDLRAVSLLFAIAGAWP